MAGIFGLFDFTKPGKGIDRDAPEKHPFFLFFELLWRKLGRLIFLNFIYFILILPLITAGYYCLYGVFMTVLESAGGDLSELGASLLPSILLNAAGSLPLWFSAALLVLSAILYGPVSCGMSFMLRNFVRQQHAWNSDFYDKFKQNFKQGLVLGLSDLTILFLFFYNLTVTWFGAGADVGGLMTVVRYATVAALLIYLFMRHYFFVMTVTFELNIRQIIKNAWVFSVLGLWRNILALVINAVLFASMLIVPFFLPIYELIMAPIILFSLTGFVSMFLIYPVLKKYMIDPQTAATAEEGE